MRTALTCVCAWVSLLGVIATSPALAADRTGPFQFDNIIYNLPSADWNKGGVTPLYVVLSPKNAAAVELYVLRGEPIEASADLHKWAGKRMGDLATSLGAVQLDADKSKLLQQDLKDSTIHTTPVVVDTQTWGTNGTVQHLRIGIAFRAKDLGEMIVLETRSPADAQQYLPPFLAFASDLHLVNLGAKPLLGQPTPGSLDGIYWANVMGYGVGGMQLQNRFYLFSKTGRFHSGMPAGQPIGKFDFTQANSLTPDASGNYRVAGGKLVLDYADGGHDELDSHTEQATLVISGAKYSPMKPPADGLRLDGTFKSSSYTEFMSGTGIKGGVSSSNSYRFRKDGSFDLGSFSGASGNFHNNTGDVTGSFGSSGNHDNRGTYQIKDGLLTLKNTDGSTVNRSVLMPDQGGMLFLDGISFLQDKPGR